MTLSAKPLVVLFILVLSARQGPWCAAQTKSEQVTIVSHVDIIPDAYKPQSEETAAALLRSETAATQHDDGLLSYIILQQSGATNHFSIIETWRDATSYQRHQGATHTVQFRNSIQPFLGGPFDSREHHLFH